MAKKNFKDNPALKFISTPIEEQQEAKQVIPQEKAPAGYKMNPAYVETKSRRLQLVMQPSLYERVKKAAANKGLSVNEYIHQVLDETTREV